MHKDACVLWNRLRIAPSNSPAEFRTVRFAGDVPDVGIVRAKFLSISFVRQIRLPRFAGEANLPPELLATHLAFVSAHHVADGGDDARCGGHGGVFQRR